MRLIIRVRFHRKFLEEPIFMVYFGDTFGSDSAFPAPNEDQTSIRKAYLESLHCRTQMNSYIPQSQQLHLQHREANVPNTLSLVEKMKGDRRNTSSKYPFTLFSFSSEIIILY